MIKQPTPTQADFDRAYDRFSSGEREIARRFFGFDNHKRHSVHELAKEYCTSVRRVVELLDGAVEKMTSVNRV